MARRAVHEPLHASRAPYVILSIFNYYEYILMARRAIREPLHTSGTPYLVSINFTYFKSSINGLLRHL
jgi:hypothetical protein